MGGGIGGGFKNSFPEGIVACAVALQAFLGVKSREM